jgi:hypothetical protein
VKDKTIRVEEELWIKLSQFKIDKRLKSLNNVLQEIITHYEKTKPHEEHKV